MESGLQREGERETPTYAAMYTNATLRWIITGEGKIERDGVGGKWKVTEGGKAD